jgi:hypothetical protein
VKDLGLHRFAQRQVMVTTILDHIGEVELVDSGRAKRDRHLRFEVRAPGHGLVVDATFIYAEWYKRVPRGWRLTRYQYDYLNRRHGEGLDTTGIRSRDGIRSITPIASTSSARRPSHTTEAMTSIFSRRMRSSQGSTPQRQVLIAATSGRCSSRRGVMKRRLHRPWTPLLSSICLLSACVRFPARGGMQ